MPVTEICHNARSPHVRPPFPQQDIVAGDLRSCYFLFFYVHCLCPRLPKQHANISSKSHAPASPSPRASMEPMRGTICTLGMFSGHCLCASHASYLYPHLNMWQYFLQYVHLQYFFFHVTTCTMPRISSYTLQHGILTRAQVDDHTCWNFILPPLLHVCFLKGLWPWMGA